MCEQDRALRIEMVVENIPSDSDISGAVAHLERSRATLKRALVDVPLELRQTRPAPDSWSAAEVLEHLVIVEGAVTRMLRRASAGPPAETTPSVPLDLSAVVDRRRRITTSPPSQPARGLSAEQAWNELQETRVQLLHLIASVEPAIWSRVRAPHFVFGVLDGVDWVRFVAGHEERHAAQVDETAIELFRQGAASRPETKDS